MTRKEYPIAVAALIISLLSATFSVYQFFDGERQAHINSALEISKAYLMDKEVRHS
jgi:hypothetical protein